MEKTARTPASRAGRGPAPGGTSPVRPAAPSTHTPLPRPLSGPRLGVVWESKRGTFLVNLRLAVGKNRLHAVHGPQPRYFGDFWHRAATPIRIFALSFLTHVFLVNAPLFGWGRFVPRPPLDAPRIELVWHGAANDLPLIAPRAPRAKESARPRAAIKEPQRGADTFHPRQTIIASPPRVTHPRQLLVQPSAPPDPPKILPELPNIVQWARAPEPARPRLRVRAPVVTRARARTATRVADLAAPDMQNPQALPGEIPLAVSQAAVEKPRLAVKPVVLAQRRGRPAPGEAGSSSTLDPVAPPGPDGIPGGSDVMKNLIALSASPAAPQPEVEVPPGNLSARLSISPDGSNSGSAGNNGNGNGGGEGSSKFSGIPDVYISGGNPANTQPIAGLGGSGNPGSGSGSAPVPAPAPATPLPARPSLGKPLDLRAAPMRPAAQPGTANSAATRPGAGIAEEVLGPRQIYTLHVNMPNLASATGSWVLNFAPLGSASEASAPGLRGLLREENPADLTGPVPLRKVDPNYPPALADAGVQGEVVLYAIIRKDGSVDSIQLVRGVEVQLDQNAMQALSRWKFRPAERRGEPVELEAVVRIPFRPFLP